MQQELTKIILGLSLATLLLGERHMGDPQQRLTLTKQSCMGITRQPMKVSNQFNAH